MHILKAKWHSSKCSMVKEADIELKRIKIQLCLARVTDIVQVSTWFKSKGMVTCACAVFLTQMERFVTQSHTKVSKDFTETPSKCPFKVFVNQASSQSNGRLKIQRNYSPWNSIEPHPLINIVNSHAFNLL